MNKRRQNFVPETVKSIFLFLMFFYLLPSVCIAQVKTITGSVKDQAGVPVQFASVALKGTSTGTTTDQAGKFTLKISGDGTLIISSINYKRTEVPTTGKTLFDITLVQDANNLTDVVVVGYGTQAKRDLTGSVASAPIADMQKAPVGSFLESLQGRIAGVVIASGDGQPGSVPNITIRGANSISQNNSPLWVIDGFPIENPDNNGVDQNDIESIEILKDASATAIYGARGANGVILVTTKKGKIGPPVVAFNFSQGSQKIIKEVSVMSPYEFVKYQRERDSLSNKFYINSKGATTPGYDSDSTYLRYAPLSAYKNVTGNDYQKQLFRTSTYHNYSLNLSGGNATTRYSVSGNVFQQDGIIYNSGYGRNQGRFQLDQTITDKLKFGVVASYSNVKTYGGAPTYIDNNFPQASYSLFTSVWGNRPITPLGANLTQQYNLEDLLGDPATFIGGGGDYRVNPLTNQLHTTQSLTSNNLRYKYQFG
jgi:TonB-linked SusC/RagA family outer membrane protein